MSEKIAYSLPGDLYDQAETRATELGMTVNAYAKKCLADALLEYATRHHVYVKAPADSDTSIGRKTVEPRWKKSMKESKA